MIDDELYEIVAGKRVILTHNALGAWLGGPLANFVRSKGLGGCIPHALFHLPAPIDRFRRPDIAFVSYQRRAKNRPMSRTDDAWNVVRNLAKRYGAEVIESRGVAALGVPFGSPATPTRNPSCGHGSFEANDERRHAHSLRD